MYPGPFTPDDPYLCGLFVMTPRDTQSVVGTVYGFTE